jgi:hypothetical protein
MLKFLTGLTALGMLIAVSATTPADARQAASPVAQGKSEMTDFSSQYYYGRRYRRYAPYYGYYRPYPYYYRPYYYRPAPFPFFPFSPYW